MDEPISERGERWIEMKPVEGRVGSGHMGADDVRLTPYRDRSAEGVEPTPRVHQLPETWREAYRRAWDRHAALPDAMTCALQLEEALRRNAVETVDARGLVKLRDEQCAFLGSQVDELRAERDALKTELRAALDGLSIERTNVDKLSNALSDNVRQYDRLETEHANLRANDDDLLKANDGLAERLANERGITASLRAELEKSLQNGRDLSKSLLDRVRQVEQLLTAAAITPNPPATFTLDDRALNYAAANLLRAHGEAMRFDDAKSLATAAVGQYLETIREQETRK